VVGHVGVKIESFYILYENVSLERYKGNTYFCTNMEESQIKKICGNDEERIKN